MNPTAGDSSSPSGLLEESARQWVFQNLPYDRSDDALSRHLQHKDAHGLLVEYLNWRSRLIPALRRTVHRSTALDNNALSNNHARALAAIIADIQSGNDLTKYLSRRTQTAVALPAKSKTKLDSQRNLDLLLNDWGIHHLHLSTTVESDGFVKRTGPLLFCFFTLTDAYLIDIISHGGWTDRRLIEVMFREFPASGCVREIKGVLGLSFEPTEAEHTSLRNAAINVAHMIDGHAVMPSAGMVSTGYPLRASMQADKILIALDNFQQSWDMQPDFWQQWYAEKGYPCPIAPNYSFEIHPEYGPGVIEPSVGVFFPLFS